MDAFYKKYIFFLLNKFIFNMHRSLGFNRTTI